MYELRKEYQLPAHLDTIEHCKKSVEPAFHSMSVGAGKSINIAFFAKHVIDKGGRALILARQGELIEQLTDDYWSIGGKCSVFSASLNKRSTYYPCILGTEGTVCRSLDAEFREIKFNVLIIDECHTVDWEDVVKDAPESQYGRIIKHLLVNNPKMRIIGYTGSPYRTGNTILDKFWMHQLSDVGTYQLINMGFLVPPVFGFGDEEHKYNLSDFGKSSKHDDYSAKELAAMGRAISKDKDRTQVIMEEVVERTRERLGVLITCASKKHCEQVSDCLPADTWGIVTDSTSTKDRRRILKDAKTGRIKYVLQIGCLTTGINVPYWDCCVILRKIGSLTLLIQLMGRVLRTLKPEQLESGLLKHDALILDYAGTFESMGDVFNDPIIGKAKAAQQKGVGETQDCQDCGAENSEFAVRCCAPNDSSSDGRCEYFFKGTMCLKCKTMNAPTAQSCRSCHAIMIDPNKALVNKAYSDADYKPVERMDLDKTKTGKLKVIYYLDANVSVNGQDKREIATQILDPKSKEAHQRGMWWKFLTDHINGQQFRNSYNGISTVEGMIKMKAMLDVPEFMTHRINNKGFSIISRKKFRSGREVK
jgi:DNA repair protein RadD